MTNKHINNEELDFDTIASRYDLANRVISLGLDMSWRRRLISSIPGKSELRLLDLATGTGDIAIMANDSCANVTEIVGLDKSTEMLNVARQKADGRAIGFVQGDILELPFEEGSFDCVTLVFGLRNVSDPAQAISEISRVLSDDGVLLILEFTMPEKLLARMLFGCYFRFIMPLLAGVIAGKIRAYRYLYKSVRDFYRPDEMVSLLAQKGFKVSREPLTISAVWLYTCQKRLC